ncbi:DNA polymerase IV (DinB-like DNA polymerase) [Halorientalis persicus]|uniref:DNA polymerase IV n=1 Tax=Halorientalis persicus TaxID=1367881 RepID=A0A1H8VEG3_9EURY|nr:DNA polymerase IV [Halorientalis persicus]SEP13644.1 DNA polymerase IV (DinB-like DNA polymerase) [Halorientalis persicus]
MDGRLPGVDDGSPEQVICHVDMDCFYAACERLREPALEGEPLVVGMGYESGETHGAVATASYEAREFGVESAMAISQALDLLPRKVDAVDDPEIDPEVAGFYRTVDLDYYESVASEVKEILHDTADTVREVSIDEAYLDVTGTVDWESAREFGQELKDRIEDEVGVVASVGVAPTMSAAKIASDHDKPDGLVVVEPGDVRDFLAALDVAEVHNVGPVTARELRSMGVETAGDLADTDPERLEDRFGERGREIWSYARGEDDRPVEPVGKPKSLSRESAFTEATDDGEHKRERVRALAGDVAERASSKDALYRTIGIKVVTPPFDVHTRAKSLPGPVEDADLVEEVALDLLTEFRDDEVRKVGVRVSNLDFSDAQQASLDGFEGASAGDAGAGRRENHSLGEFEDGRTEREDTGEETLGSRGQTSLGEFE